MAPFWLRQIWAFRNTLTIVLIPLLLLPLPVVIPGTESACAYVILVMALYWVTEALPLAITAFIPIILYPMMGIMAAGDVSRVYLPDTNWLLIGGLMISIAIEETNLHKRIALRILLIFGAKPRLLMMGFMVTSFFLSMWISNTATTAMMLPIVEAVFAELKKGLAKKPMQKRRRDSDSSNGGHDNNGFVINDAEEVKTVTEKTTRPNEDFTEEVTSFSTNDDITVTREVRSTEIEVKGDDGMNGMAYVIDDDSNSVAKKTQEIIEEDTEEMNNLIKAITLCVPYSASIGGTATLTGTAPNLVLSGQFEELFPDAPQLLSFGGWIVYCLPGAVTALIFAYIWLSFYFLGFNLEEIKSCICCGRRTEAEEKAQQILRQEHRKLGPIRWGEGTVMGIFILTVLLWFFREPGFMPGWGLLFDDLVADGTVATTMGFLLCILPREMPDYNCHTRDDVIKKPRQPILTWRLIHSKMAWDVLFLLGGGFAMASGATESGLSTWIGSQLTFLEGIDPWLICLICTVIVCFFTECSSNTATASLFVPILAELAVAIQVHPLYLMVGPVLAASHAFMLPAATPPNAIAFSYGRLRVIDLMKAGWMLNLIGIAVITLYINTYGVAYFGLNDYPSWAPGLPSPTTTAMFDNVTSSL